MTKFHLTPDGEAKICTASEGKCKYAENNVDPEHYSSKEEASKAYKKLNQDNIFQTLRNSIPKVQTKWFNSLNDDELKALSFYGGIGNHRKFNKNLRNNNLNDKEISIVKNLDSAA